MDTGNSSMRRGTAKQFDDSLSESQKDDEFDVVADQENQFGNLLLTREPTTIIKLSDESGGKISNDKHLNEPQIYANKLLGRKVNTSTKIIMKNRGGTIAKEVVDVNAITPVKDL